MTATLPEPTENDSTLLKQARQEIKELSQKLLQLQETYRRLEQENSILKQELQLSLNGQLEDGGSNPSTPTVAPNVTEQTQTKPAPLLVKEPSAVVTSAPPAQAPSSPPAPLQNLSPEGKINLFRKLFFSRLDAYAKRWESAKNGKSGYMPVLNHEGQPHRYDTLKKKDICLAQCPNIPVTAEIIKHHLQGKSVIGSYPLTHNDTCIFLAIDLDKEHWQEEASALSKAALTFGIKAYIERSRSGNGGHVWIFFDSPVPASQARKLGDALITRANRDLQQIELKSYDRMFPNQDTLPSKGYGNLIALPLQREALLKGNSVFLKDNFTPYEDQWALLLSIKKVSKFTLNSIVQEAERRQELIPIARPQEDEEDDENDEAANRNDPWTIPPSGHLKNDSKQKLPLPQNIELTLSNLIYINKQGLSRGHLQRITRLAAFQNPEFYKKQNLRLSTYGIPRIIIRTEEFPDTPQYLGLPRGCLDELTTLINESGGQFTIKDERYQGKKIKAKFTGKLRPEQSDAAKNLLSHDIGILSATTAFGKTVVAAHCIAKRKVNTLVLVHRTELLRQWKQRLSEFLELPDKAIGQIGGSKNKPSGIIDIATIQSLIERGKKEAGEITPDQVKDLVAEYGQIIVDECHHLAANSFEKILRQVKAKYVLGLTATPFRRIIR